MHHWAQNNLEFLGSKKGNLDIAASILLSGSSYVPLKEAMDIAKINTISETKFYRIQKKTLFPAINNVYQKTLITAQ